MGVIEEQIMKATDASLARPDKDLVAKIIQYLVNHPESHSSATEVMKRRFEERNVKVQMLTLFLLDKAMKKLDNRFFSYVGNKAFLNCLILILTDEDSVDMIK